MGQFCCGSLEAVASADLLGSHFGRSTVLSVLGCDRAVHTPERNFKAVSVKGTYHRVSNQK